MNRWMTRLRLGREVRRLGGERVGAERSRAQAAIASPPSQQRAEGDLAEADAAVAEEVAAGEVVWIVIMAIDLRSWIAASLATAVPAPRHRYCLRSESFLRNRLVQVQERPRDERPGGALDRRRRRRGRRSSRRRVPCAASRCELRLVERRRAAQFVGCRRAGQAAAEEIVRRSSSAITADRWSGLGG